MFIGASYNAEKLSKDENRLEERCQLVDWAAQFLKACAALALTDDNEICTIIFLSSRRRAMARVFRVLRMSSEIVLWDSPGCHHSGKHKGDGHQKDKKCAQEREAEGAAVPTIFAER